MPRTRTVASIRRDNLRVVRRLMEEVWAIGDLTLLRELVANDYVGHVPIGDHYGPVGAPIDIESYRRAMPDLSISLADLYAVDDKVVCRFPLLGTHALPFFGSSTTREIVESWIRLDDSSLKNPVLP